MFCNIKGRSLNPESISQLFTRAVARSKLPRIRYHDLRHTHASLLVAAGVPIKVVTERLGHAHPGLTMNTYQHVLPGEGRRQRPSSPTCSVRGMADRRLPGKQPPQGQRGRSTAIPVTTGGPGR